MDTDISLAPLAPQDPPSTRDGLRQAIRETGDDLVRDANQRMVTTFNAAIRTQPEAAAEAQDIARQLGLAPTMIEGNLEVAREAARKRAFRQRDFARTSPVLAVALQDVEFAKIAQDDLDDLAGTEGFFRRLSKAATRGDLTNELGYVGSRLLAQQLAGGALDPVDQRRLAWMREQLQALPESDGILQNTAEVIGGMASTVTRAMAAGAAAGGLASLGGPISAGTAAAWGTGAALFGQSAVIEGGNAYVAMLDAGLDADAAARAAVGVGLVNGALELVGEELTFGLASGARRALSKRITKEVAEGLAKQTVGKAALQAAGRYATGVSAEVGTEVLQEVVNVLGEQAAGGDPQQVGDRLVEIALKTAQGMALLGGINPGARFVRDAQRASAAERLQQTFVEPLVESATNSKVAQRNPDAFRAFVGKAAEGTGTETSYIDGQRFAEVLQQLEIPDDQLDAALPGLSEQVRDAVATGGDVVVPTADLAAKLGRTELLGALAPHVRFDPDAMAFSDAEQFRAAEAEMQKTAAKAVEAAAASSQEWRQSLDQVRQEMRTQLQGVIGELRAQDQKGEKKGQRLRTQDAGALAETYATMTAVLAQRAGMLPHEFQARFPLRVAAGEGWATLQQFGTIDSATADLASARAANDRLQAGEDPEAVRRETGWHRAPDGRMVYEIDDSQARFVEAMRSDRLRFGDARARLTPDSPVTRLGDLIEHPSLFAAYPWLTDVRVTEAPGGTSTRGTFQSPGRGGEHATIAIAGDLGSESAMDALMHEVQHALQWADQRPRGADASKVGSDAYRRNAGEVEARNTAERRLMSADQRREVSPEATADVRRGDLLFSGSRGSFDPKKLQLFLSREADPTTFLHELGHFYLTQLADLAAQPNAPAAIAEDMQVLLQWWGVESLDAWHAMTLEQQRKHHEQFAYSFETYLFDGLAPTNALKKVFGRIAQWFRLVYRALRDRINKVYRDQFGEDLPVLTPEVRQVFDRMLASEAEILAAQEQAGMAAVFESQAQAGVGDAQWADYIAGQQDATNAAIDEHTRDSLRQMQWLAGARSRVLRELQARHKALRAGVREDVEADLRSEPVHRARQFLVHGEWVDVDGAPAGKVDGAQKLSLEALKAFLPEGTNTKGLTGRNGIAAAKGGMDPTTAAQLFGFADAAAMVRELLSAPPLADAVESATDARMLEEHGDIADPKQRERMVAEALHNELRTRQIAVEQRMLTKTAQPVRLMTAAAKEAAERIVGRQKVWLVDPRGHEVSERRATRQVNEALRAGDAAAAIAAQRNRMLQHQLVKAAVTALDDVQAAEETAAQFYERDDQVSQRRDIDLVYVGRTLAAMWGFGPRLQGQEAQLAYAALATVRADNPQLAAYAEAWMDRHRVQGGTYREMAVADLRELHQVLEGVWSAAGEAKTLEIEGRRVQVKAAGERLASHIAAKPARAASASAPKGISPSPAQRGVLKLWNVFAHLKRFTFWARFMDGGDRVREVDAREVGVRGPFSEYFTRPILAATARYRAARDEMVSAVHPRIVALQKAAGARWDAPIAAPELDGHVFRGLKEVIGALLHAGTYSNLEKLLVGYGWVEAPNEQKGEALDTSKWDKFLRRMFDKDKGGVLTQQHTEFASFIWGLYKQQLPENQKTHKALYGFEFKAIEHRKVATPWGELEGGYVPAYADPDAKDGNGKRLGQIADTIEGDAAAFSYSVSTGRGHTLARNPFYRKPLALDLAQQVRHMDAQLRFTYVQPALKGAMRVVRQSDFSKAIDAYDREAVESVMLPWLENVALQSTSRPSGMPLLDMGATMLRRVSSLAALGFNVGNALIQSTGIANSVAVVKGRYLRAGLATVLKSIPGAIHDAAERSPWMQDRMSQRAEKMREEIQRAGSEQPLPFLPADFVRGWKATSRALGRLALMPQRFTQGFVDLVTWHGAFQQAMAEAKVDGTMTLEEAEAAAREAADDAVRHTQGGGGPEDLAAYESGTPVMKLFTQFGSYSNVVLNGILAAGDTKAARARAALWVLLVPALLEPTIRMLLAGAPDDDDGDGRMDELAALYAGAAVRNVVGLVPGAGPMALAMAESDGKRVISSPAASTMQAAFRGVAGAWDVVTGEGDVTGADARAWGQLLTMITGMPIAPVGRAAGYALDVEAGKRKPMGTGDYLRGLVVGR